MTSDSGALPTPTVRERELELALMKIEQMSRPITGEATMNGRKVPMFGRAENGSLERAARIAREALRDT